MLLLRWINSKCFDIKTAFLSKEILNKYSDIIGIFIWISRQKDIAIYDTLLSLKFNGHISVT